MNKLYETVKNHRVVVFFLLSLLFGYSQWIFAGKPNWFIYGMLIAGLILTALYEGKAGIMDQLRNAIRFKSSYKNYLYVLLTLLALNIAALALAYLFYGDLPSLAMIKNEPHMIPVLILVTLTGGPIAEELFGLRGFALPKLLAKHTPLLSSLIVGFFFGAWHLIEFFRPGSSQYAIGLGFYPLFILDEIAHSILMTWIYLRSGWNLFVGGIFFHLTMNVFLVLFQTDFSLSNMSVFPKINSHYFVIYTLIAIGFAVFIVVKTKMYQKNGSTGNNTDPL
jgi:membrane protease YdiL (CAAX protease family)